MIKRQIFVITIFLSNIAFTTVLPADSLEAVRNITTTQEQNQETKITLHSAVVSYLINNGLDDDIATARVQATLKHSEQEANILTHKIIQDRKVSYNDLIKYIAKAALHKKQVNLASYEEITALIQRRHA